MTVKLLLILAVLSAVSALSIGDPICGPESCNNLNTVQSCKNVNYCISNIWTKIIPTGERDNVCDICLRMVKEARDQLQSNETMLELKEVLEGSCKLMLLKPAVKICKKLADEFVPELVDILSSQMDPETICTIVKLCNNDVLKKELQNSVECTSCSEFMSSASNVLTKTPISQLTMQYINICRSSGTFSEACTYYLLQNPEPFFNMTRKILQNNPCEALRFCPKGNVKSVDLAPQNSKSWQESKIQMCHICPKFMENLHQLLKTTSDVENLILNTCISLSFANDVCSRFAAENFEIILSYFQTNASYEFICSHLLGLCIDNVANSTGQILFPTEKSSISLEKIGKVNFSEEMINVRTSTFNQSGRLKLSFGDPLPGPIITLPEEKFLGSSNKECQSCIEIFLSASKYLNAHRDYVNSVLRASCYNVEDFGKCINFTNIYENLFTTPEIFAPEKICPAIVPFCNGKSLLHLLEKQQYPNQDSCRFCVTLIQSLKNGSKTDVAKFQVTSGLKEACERVPEESQLMCDIVAENYVKNLVSSVTPDNDNIITCSSLNMCSFSPRESLRPKVTCKTCLLVVQTIYEELKDISNEDEIRRILDVACDKLSGKAKEYCILLVDTYSDALVHLLIDNLDATAVCDKLHFCNPPKNNDIENSLNTNLETTGKPTSVSKVSCSFCLTAMKMLIDKLEDNKTEDAIKHTLDKLCTYMPAEVKDTCSNLINQYSEDIIDMIIADFNATEICIYLKICGPKAESLKSLLMFSPGFSITTNEIHNKPQHIGGPCHFCQMMERSMAIRGYENKGAEGMLGLLVDVCMMDVENLYGDCAKKFSEEILPYGKDALLAMNNICSNMKICPKENLDKFSQEKKILKQLESSVQECAMCETIAAVVSSHKIMLSENYNFVANASLLCSGVPGNRKQMCESMIVSYAPSMVNLLNRKGVKRDDVCSSLSLCDVGYQTKVNMPVTSIEQSGIKHLEESGECLKGPSFWCANLENSEKCGTTLHCQETVWKTRRP